MADNARKTHVSPGVYSREIDLNSAVKSLGLTTLGVAGETLKGPAFEPIRIEDWAQFKDTFGGTSTEKFKGSQYPKYELPYIAKSYLSESKQLEVCRVLGLSGFNAGPAWAVTAKRTVDGVESNMVVAVIRSRGYYNAYEHYEATPAECRCGIAAHDKLRYYVGELTHVPECEYVTRYNASALTITEYLPIDATGDACSTYNITSGKSSWEVSSGNYGKFTLSGSTAVGTTYGQMPEEQRFKYSVSLNPQDNDYILKVIGSNPYDGDAPIYVESLYDVALIQGIEALEINKINSALTFYNVCYAADLNTVPQINGFVDKEEGALTRRDLGKRFLYAKNYCDVKTTYHKFFYNKGGVSVEQREEDDTIVYPTHPMTEGGIYTVRSYVDYTNKRHFVQM